MASFVIGRPLTTAEPTIAVDPGLKAGAHRFRLEVVDDSGLVSAPSEAVVQVAEQVVTAPPATLAPLNTVVTPAVHIATPTATLRPVVAAPTPTLRPIAVTRPPAPRRPK